MRPEADQFYTGLIAALYDALVSEKPDPHDYARFIDRAGQPALEPFCGSGRPLLISLEWATTSTASTARPTCWLD